jgi:protein-L-isoaspartate(D-aspartate) O-methyltransferase
MMMMTIMTTTSSPIPQAVRQFFAEDACFHAQSWQWDATCPQDPRLIEAFAAVPREDFLGRTGPWLIKNWQSTNAWFWTVSADLRNLYHDVAVALDGTGERSNGMPSQYAFFLSHLGVREGEAVLHIGAGAGYYSAILATLAGPSGKVLAVEKDAALALRAAEALKPWPQATLLAADGSRLDLAPDSLDAILVSAGATHPLKAWLTALRVGGRLMFPMTGTDELGGRMLLITRLSEGTFAARFLCRVRFFLFEGARCPDIEARLDDAFGRDHWETVESLRCDDHPENGACWLHGDQFCLSRLAPAR